MTWKRRAYGSVLGLIGFMLSPLSWWNDLFLNVPLAVGFAWLVALLYPPAFQAAVVVGYWLTNVIGFILLHYGARTALTAEAAKPFSRRELIKDLAISLLYTLLIVVLVKLNVIKPIAEY